MNRRDFLKNSAVLAATQAIALPAAASQTNELPQADNTSPAHTLIDSAPMLQNYAETSMGIAFSVTANANGYVIYGEMPDLSDGTKVYCGGYRVTAMNADVMQIRLTGLKPSTTYYYRIGADRINYGHGQNMKIIGNEEPAQIYSFRTAGKEAKGHFCVINDTHMKWKAFEKEIGKILEIGPSCVIWNGDTCNTLENIKDQKIAILQPKISQHDFAARIPYLFSPGNHDSRGLANRTLERVWMFRQPEERSSRDWDLGRNFAVRMGEIAVIGLDTAEDKMDSNPLFANLFRSAPYRQVQVQWLQDALKRKEIATAPYLVAFCHIPLFDSDPTANPGDVAPADKDPRYSTDYALWQRTCANLWTPLLEKAGCQLIVCAHQHKYRFDAPTEDRPWAQMVGGGCEESNPDAEDFPTVIEGITKDGSLTVRAYNVLNGELIDERTFKPRKVRRSK